MESHEDRIDAYYSDGQEAKRLTERSILGVRKQRTSSQRTSNWWIVVGLALGSVLGLAAYAQHWI
ncbi:hypothetical protein J2S49_001599 [Arcanobacterium wilhelmae]|uniref:Uncharacterized protein n=1 Tax=Arcanobacterium wilhelmae TaxID=1803177 RepID=A0ABT9NCV6_9ACTO|nr:hypothetical protein [Arcanobacterium wilhelmae]MDP9801523.1 hypothetical protein [Arcanobacterium wilhelmae]WFN90853.1 hypothetical protein P8A24_03075 [Arcanobacterium wilhelmae]